MSNLREIEAAVSRLSPDDIAAFGTWFDSFRVGIAATLAPGELVTRLKAATRAQRRTLAIHAANESADHYRRRSDEVLPDILDEPS